MLNKHTMTQFMTLQTIINAYITMLLTIRHYIFKYIISCVSQITRHSIWLHMIM